MVVVDDGSTDGSADGIEKLQRDGAVRLRCLRRPPLGPAAARNAGVRQARGEVVLFLGDDMMASPQLVATHATYHETNPEPFSGALGYVTWSPEIKVTPFMRWLEQGGPQFAYDAIWNSENVPVGHFYTANVSVKRPFLLTWGLFDESLRHAAFEDFDLGQRLGAKGLRLTLIREAAAYHLHPTTISSACHRMMRLGEAAAALRPRYPELVWVEQSESSCRRFRRSLLLSPWVLALSRLVAWPLQHLSCTPTRLYRVLLDAHYRRGVRAAMRTQVSQCAAEDGQ